MTCTCLVPGTEMSLAAVTVQQEFTVPAECCKFWKLELQGPKRGDECHGILQIGCPH